jgi:hypothetical protein
MFGMVCVYVVVECTVATAKKNIIQGCIAVRCHAHTTYTASSSTTYQSKGKRTRVRILNDDATAAAAACCNEQHVMHNTYNSTIW